MYHLSCTKQILATLIVCAVLIPTILISGQAGSWSEEDGYFGDLDPNHTINASDALVCLQASVQLITLTEEQIKVGDVDGNGTVNASDALFILQLSVSLIKQFPIYEQTQSKPDDPSSELPPVSSDVPSDSSSSVTLPEDPEIKDFGYEEINSSIYYCYNQLNQEQRRIYGIIHENAWKMTRGKFSIGDGEISQTDVRLAFAAYTNDHPEVFWLPKGYLYSSTSKETYLYFSDKDNKIDYTCNEAERIWMAVELSIAVRKAFREALVPGLTPVERELRLHDWLSENCTYNQAAVSDSDRYPEAFTSYGALVSGSAVCEGYSRAFQLLCYYAGIECTPVTGIADGGSHMWNAVKLNGYWYLVDTTWDSDSPAIHTFCNQNSDSFNLNHQPYATYNTMSENELLEAPGFNFILPDFNHTECEYHSLFGVVTTTKDASTNLADSIALRVNSGADVVEIMVTDKVFITMTEASDFIAPYINEIVGKLDRDRIPTRYSCSIVPNSNCIVLSFVY